MLITHDTYLAERILRANHGPLSIVPAMTLEMEAEGVPVQSRDALRDALHGAAGYESKGLLLVEEHALTYTCTKPGWRLYLPCLWPMIRADYNPVTVLAADVVELLRAQLAPGVLVSTGDDFHLAHIHVRPENERAARRWLAERLGNQALRRKLASLAAGARRSAHAREEAHAAPSVYLDRLVQRTFRFSTDDLIAGNPVLHRRLGELALDLRESRLRRMAAPPNDTTLHADELAQIATTRCLLSQRA